mmetsp:Transcript_36294/g.114550  ORF Transcript_36294/g.114550 Transcript_36294/m.114550 type:complete len:162 (+) Transcript_36294:813-1298(+)
MGDFGSCDYCGTGQAVVFCNPDNARLCIACDRKVHGVNVLAQRHPRSWICDACRSLPCMVYCPVESAVLCQYCDERVHANMDAQAHQRVQVRGFSWSPTMHDAVTPEHFMSLGAQGIPADWPGAVPVQYVGGYGGGWPMPSGYAYAMDGPPPCPHRTPVRR